MLFSGVTPNLSVVRWPEGVQGAKPPEPVRKGRRFRGRLFLLRRTWQMSRQANLLSQPLNFGFGFSSCCDGALNQIKIVLRSKTSFSHNGNFDFEKINQQQFCFRKFSCGFRRASGRSRPPPTPPAPQVRCRGCAPAPPLTRKQQFTVSPDIIRKKRCRPQCFVPLRTVSEN